MLRKTPPPAWQRVYGLACTRSADHVKPGPDISVVTSPDAQDADYWGHMPET